MTELKVKLIHPSAQLPTRGNPGDAGLDLYAVGFVEAWQVKSPVARPETEYRVRGDWRFVAKTGIAVSIPEGHVGLIRPRSGLALHHGIDTMAGVIDPGYTGEILVILIHHGPGDFTIKAGEKVAQVLILPVPEFEPVQVEELSETVRGAGGFGSTGR